MALLSDFRHAVRVLRKAPLFSLTSILSLAVGIAASTAIFSLADAMLFRPRVGITEPERVVDIGRGMRGEGSTTSAIRCSRRCANGARCSSGCPRSASSRTR